MVPSKTATAQPHKNTTFILLSIILYPEQKNRRKKFVSKRYCREKEPINKARNEKETREKDKTETESSITIS